MKKHIKRTRSAINLKNSKITSTIKYSLSPEQIYQLNVNKIEFGIEGYEPPRQYYDYKEVMWKKKREKILSARKHLWPPLDWPRDKNDDKKRIKPKRMTYIDELKKWCDSFYDAKKAESLIEERNINIKEYEPPVKIDRDRRKKFLEKEKKREEWKKQRPPYPEFKSDAIKEAEEKKKKHEEERQKDPINLIIKRYKDRPSTSRCDKVSVISEAIHIGEQIPFYNTYVPEGKTLDKNKLFYPKKDFVLRRSPSWKYPLPIGPNEEHKKIVDEQEKEKLEEYMNDNDLKKNDLWIKISEGYKKLYDHGQILIKIAPKYNYKELEQYKVAKEHHPDVYIGPQQYWKMPKQNPRKESSISYYGTMTDDKGNKVYYMDRKRTDKRVYTVGLRRSVY